MPAEQQVGVEVPGRCAHGAYGLGDTFVNGHFQLHVNSLLSTFKVFTVLRKDMNVAAVGYFLFNL